MSFGSPQWLLLLALALPGLVLLFWWAERERKALLLRFVRARLLPGLLVGLSPVRRKVRRGLVLAAVALLLLVLAKPRWGFSIEEVKQRGLDVVVALDVSRSMLADDIRPNRLERAKMAALDLKQLAKADRMALVAFAGSAFLQCPLCTDDEVFRQSLNALDVKIIPQGGTAIAEAIRTALTAFKEKSDNYKILVLFTDGEDHDGEALSAAKEAAKEGMRIFTVGVGTPAGELISTVDDQGRRAFLKDSDGQAVKSHLNQSLLEDIARATQGFYLQLVGSDTMEKLYKSGLALLPKTEFGGTQRQQYHERYQWFLGIALLLLMVEFLLPERKPEPKPRAATAPAKATTAAALLICLCCSCSAWGASPATALRKYQRQKYDSSQLEFEKLAEKNPDDPRLRFNAGAAAYQAKQYEDAVKHFNAATTAPDVKLQQRAYYNLGDAQYRLGEAESDPQKKIEHWQDSVQCYENATKLDPKDPDAKFNDELVKRMIEELKKQQQQKQKQDQNKDDQKKDDKKDDQKDQQKQDQQKQDQQKQDQQKQDQQKKDEQKKKDEEKKQQEQQQQQKDSQENQEKQDEQEQAESTPARPMQMTRQQAQRLLDMQKVDERPMIFVPQLKTNRQDRVFKDW